MIIYTLVLYLLLFAKTMFTSKTTFNAKDYISIQSLSTSLNPPKKQKKEKQNNANWLLRDNDDFDDDKIKRKKIKKELFKEIPMIDIGKDDQTKQIDSNMKKLTNDTKGLIQQNIEQKKTEKLLLKQQKKQMKNAFDIFGFTKLNQKKRQMIKQRNVKYRKAYKIQQQIYRDFVTQQLKIAKGFEIEAEKADELIHQIKIANGVMKETLSQFYDRNTIVDQKIRRMTLDLDKHVQQNQEDKLMGDNNLEKTKEDQGTKIKSYCGRFLDCGECIQQSDCVWCREFQKCVMGDIYGPVDGSCVYFDYGFCQDDQCVSTANCQNCIQDDQCVWCVKTQTCMSGNMNGANSRCGSQFIHKHNPIEGCQDNSSDDLKELSISINYI